MPAAYKMKVSALKKIPSSRNFYRMLFLTYIVLTVMIMFKETDSDSAPICTHLILL